MPEATPRAGEPGRPEPGDDPVEGSGTPPVPSGPPPGGPSNGTGLGALVVGIVALVLTLFGPLLGLALGVVAVVLGVVGLRKVRRGQATNRGQAISGLVTGAVAVVFAGFLSVFFLLNRDAIERRTDCLAQAETDAQQQQCEDRFQEEVGR